MKNRISMPRWPGWLLAAAAVACAYPAFTAPAPAQAAAEAGAPADDSAPRLVVEDGRLGYEAARRPGKVASTES